MVTVRGAGVIETETMMTTKETREKETNTGHRRVWGGGRRGREWGVNARISQIQVCTSENSSWGTLHHAAKGLTFGQSCRDEMVKHLKSVRRGRCDDGPERAFLYCGGFFCHISTHLFFRRVRIYSSSAVEHSTLFKKDLKYLHDRVARVLLTPVEFPDSTCIQ